MTRIRKILPVVTAQAKSLEREAHESWVRYFNSHKLYLTPPRDEFIPKMTGIRQGSIGYDKIRAKSTFDELKSEMESAVACYRRGNKKQTNIILKALSGLDTDFDVYQTFYNML